MGVVRERRITSGDIDILVNNAGLDAPGASLSVDPADLRDVVRVNPEGSIMLTRAFLPSMVERGRGHLVDMSSLGGTAGFPSLAACCSTKAGLNSFAAAMRLDLNATDITTTLVTAGPVDTDMWDGLEALEYHQAILKRMRLLRSLPKATPAELARRTVAAVEADKHHVRHPHRLSLHYWLGESPRRLTELLLTGIKFDVPTSTVG